MQGILFLVTMASVAGVVTGKISVKWAVIIGGGALVMAQFIPTQQPTA